MKEAKMISKKKLLVVATAGALTAATAVPALALENEFHGLFRVRGFISNYDDGASGTLLPKDKPGTRNFIEQRARLLYQAKANDDLKLVTHFELDSRWGDNSYNSNGTTRNNGGAIGADQTNLETKNVYLDFNVPGSAVPVNVKLGIQGFSDAYKGIIFNNDAAGLVVTSKYDRATAQIAYFRFDDATTGGSATTASNSYLTVPSAPTSAGSIIQNSNPGNLTRDFINIGGKYNVTKDIKVGADYFLLYSDILRQNTGRTNIHMIGVNAEAKVGPATVDGFAIYQLGKVGSVPTTATGVLDTTKSSRYQTVSAFAANVGAKVKVGPGTARGNVLYISGDNDPTNTNNDRNDFQTIMERGAGNAGHSFYAGEMLLLLRSKYATAGTDRAVVFDLNNSSQGLVGGFLGYDANFGKVFSYTNVGFAAVAKDTGHAHDSKYMGTEINSELGYKIYDNLSASLQGAYLVLGDYFKNTGGAALGKLPDNPFSGRVMVTYTF
jgi:hypothetical protein